MFDSMAKRLELTSVLPESTKHSTEYLIQKTPYSTSLAKLSQTQSTKGARHHSPGRSEAKAWVRIAAQRALDDDSAESSHL
jgi:hypothetical protein